MNLQNFRKIISDSGEPLVPSVARIGLPTIPPRGIEELEVFAGLRLATRIAWNKIWQEGQFDAIMIPVAAHTAVPKDIWTVVNYTGLFSFLDYPACVIPVGVVSEQDVADKAASHGKLDEQLYSVCKCTSDITD